MQFVGKSTILVKNLFTIIRYLASKQKSVTLITEDWNGSLIDQWLEFIASKFSQNYLDYIESNVPSDNKFLVGVSV